MSQKTAHDSSCLHLLPGWEKKKMKKNPVLDENEEKNSSQNMEKKKEMKTQAIMGPNLHFEIKNKEER